MPPVPVVTPDGEKILRLMYQRGHHAESASARSVVRAFAPAMRFGSARTLYYICQYNRPTSIGQIFEIARCLKVTPEDISDYAPPRKHKAA
jgi:hypothetical protein